MMRHDSARLPRKFQKTRDMRSANARERGAKGKHDEHAKTMRHTAYEILYGDRVYKRIEEAPGRAVRRRMRAAVQRGVPAGSAAHSPGVRSLARQHTAQYAMPAMRRTAREIRKIASVTALYVPRADGSGGRTKRHHRLRMNIIRVYATLNRCPPARRNAAAPAHFNAAIS